MISDKQLANDYLAGDREALESLIRRYLKPIYSFIYRYVYNEKDAEDITQDVFVKVWKNFGRFDVRRSFKTWIFSIAKNAAFDFFKKKKALNFSQMENQYKNGSFLDNLTDGAPLPQETLKQAEAAFSLNAALEKLSPKYRMTLFLRYNDHFNFREIAEALEEPLHTIKSRHRRAILMLKKILHPN